MKKNVLLVLALNFSIPNIAQVSISGLVTNDSIPLTYASVIVKNSTRGVSTNDHGEFNIDMKKGDTLSISYLGLKTKDIAVNTYTNKPIELEVDNSLEEVLIISCSSNTISCSVIKCYSVTRGCGVSCTTVMSYKKNLNEKTKLYPNPSSNGFFQLKFPKAFDTVEISVASMSGRILQRKTYSYIDESLRLDMSQYTTGIYIVNIISDGKRLPSIRAIRK